MNSSLELKSDHPNKYESAILHTCMFLCGLLVLQVCNRYVYDCEICRLKSFKISLYMENEFLYFSYFLVGLDTSCGTKGWIKWIKTWWLFSYPMIWWTPNQTMLPILLIDFLCALSLTLKITFAMYRCQIYLFVAHFFL